MKNLILSKTNPDTIKSLDNLIKYIEFCLDNVEESGIYTENHHILPKCIYPEFSDLKEHPWNSAKLSYENHYIAHSIIMEAFKSTKLIYGWSLMNGCTGKFLGRKPKELIGPELYSALKTFFLMEQKNRDYSHIKKQKAIIGEDGLTQMQRVAKKRGTDSFKIAGKLGAETAKRNNSYQKREPLRQKTMHTKKDNGLTPSEEKGMKISNQKKQIQPSGKTLAQEVSPRGLDHHSTKIIDVFDNNGNLFGTSAGGFLNFCMDNGLPHRQLQKSHLTNSKIPTSGPFKCSWIDTSIDFKDWYAVEVSCEEFLARPVL